MNKIRKCNLCGGQEFKFLFSGEDKNQGIKGEFNFVKCTRCKVIIREGSFTKKEEEDHYPKRYYSFQKIVPKDKSRKVKMRLFLQKIYSKKGINLKKIIFSPFLPYVRGSVIVREGNILDVGCGSGQFIYEMKQLGVNASGIEPGDIDLEDSRKYGIEIKKGDLTSVKYKKDFFEGIMMNHVLEHVPNPTKTIKEVYKILKKRRLFIVAVPNFDSWAFKIFGSYWYQLDIPRHNYNFSVKILKKVLQRGGFKIEKVRYNSRPDQFSVSLGYYLGKRWNTKSLFFMNLLFLPLTYISNIFERGDQIEIYCRK